MKTSNAHAIGYFSKMAWATLVCIFTNTEPLAWSQDGLFDEGICQESTHFFLDSSYLPNHNTQ